MSGRSIQRQIWVRTRQAFGKGICPHLFRDIAVTELVDSAPDDIGIAPARPEDLKGGDPAHNAAELRAVLDGAKTAYRDVALLNAAASLVVAGEAKDLVDGLARASQAIENRAAKGALERLIKSSNV